MTDDYKIPEDCERWFANIIAKLFELSAKRNYDSKQLASAFLTHPQWRSMLLSDNVFYYGTGLTYALDAVVTSANVQKGFSFDSYVMWVYGYLIKWWVYKFPEDIDFIQQIMPLESFDDNFLYWHTQGFNKIVYELHERVLALKQK